MAEYIEREALLSAYDKAHKGPPGEARKLIEEAPAADVAPLVQERWMAGFVNKERRKIGVECSGCSAFYELDLFDFGLCYNYCPNCGATMDGGGDDA